MSALRERLDRLMSRLGYCSRHEVRLWLRQGRITVGGLDKPNPASHVLPEAVLLDGEPLDHPNGLTLVYHKPVGLVCSHKEQGRLIYEDFPEQWQNRKPQLSTIGRLDKDTSGLLVLTDDGQLNHHLTSPKHNIPKIYHAILARALQGHEAEIFASGQLILEGESKPCMPAELKVLGDREVELMLHEGRYHQVRRMFAAVGNHVEMLARTHIGQLSLVDTGLLNGQFRTLENEALLAWVEKGEIPDSSQRSQSRTHD